MRSATNVASGNRLLLLTSVLGVVVLLALGTWQVQRLQWKQDLIVKRHSALAGNPVTLADIEAGVELGYDVDWLKVGARGSYRHDLERHVYSLRKGKIGWRLLTPFIVPGRFAVFVDRGFVPDASKELATRPESITGPAEGEHDIIGFVRVDFAMPGLFTPANQPGQNRWYGIDLIELANTMPDDLGFVAPDRYAAILPVVVQLAPGSAPADGLPIVDAVETDLPNKHLQYAVTWYGLAIVLVVISALFYRSRRRQSTERDDV